VRVPGKSDGRLAVVILNEVKDLLSLESPQNRRGHRFEKSADIRFAGLARMIHAAEPIKAQPFRSEGKAVLPSSCQEAFSCECTSEKVAHSAGLESQTEPSALLPSLLQGRASIYRVSYGFLEA
jgi:hypothetical protein